MRLRRVNKNHDWTFGNSQRDYITGSDAIAQSVKTRLLCFKNDDIFNLGGGIDWIGILGSRNNKETIRKEIERTVLGTVGVMRLDDLRIETLGRKANIVVKYTDAYKESTEIELAL